jgi:hypothetical protein
LQDGAGTGPHLGWNTWIGSGKPHSDAEDAVFEAEEIVFVNRPELLNN